MPEALNPCSVSLKAAVSVSSSSGLKYDAYCWKGIVDTRHAGQTGVHYSVAGEPMITRTLEPLPDAVFERCTMFAVQRTITWAWVRLAADKGHPRYTVLESATPVPRPVLSDF